MQPYFRYLEDGYSTGGCGGIVNYWAWEYIEEVLRKDPETAWTTLLLLIREAPSIDLLENLGAGHLEDFLRLHGGAYFDKIRETAKHSKRFLGALYIARVSDSHSFSSRLNILKAELGIVDNSPFDDSGDDTFAPRNA